MMLLVAHGVACTDCAYGQDDSQHLWQLCSTDHCRFVKEDRVHADTCIANSLISGQGLSHTLTV